MREPVMPLLYVTYDLLAAIYYVIANTSAFAGDQRGVPYPPSLKLRRTSPKPAAEAGTCHGFPPDIRSRTAPSHNTLARLRLRLAGTVEVVIIDRLEEPTLD